MIWLGEGVSSADLRNYASLILDESSTPAPCFSPWKPVPVLAAVEKSFPLPSIGLSLRCDCEDGGFPFQGNKSELVIILVLLNSCLTSLGLGSIWFKIEFCKGVSYLCALRGERPR